MKCKFEHDGHCCNCGATQYMIECKQPCETIVTMTNADRIRAMSDEELFVAIQKTYIGNSPWCDHHCKLDDDCSCSSCLKEWLKQPAEDE